MLTKMSKTKKGIIGIMSFLPLLVLIATLIYEDSILQGAFSSGDHHAATGIIYDNYNTLVILYGITAVLAIILLLIFIIHVARLKSMTSGRKILWISALALVMPVSFPLFWLLQVNKEPAIIETKENIS